MPADERLALTVSDLPQAPLGLSVAEAAAPFEQDRPDSYQETQDARSTGSDTLPENLGRGVALLKARVRTLSEGPGVYRMLDAKGEPLYVGKARNLKRRVGSYTQVARLTVRMQRMVAETQELEIILTQSEVEALLLESNLIKRFGPRYNVLLRDDKSFPYILITGDHDFPQIAKHRGAQRRSGRYFGPFASAQAVNPTVTALEKAFLLRSCSDSVFESRQRPCLLYQIKRCSAPCVGKISTSDYARLVRDAEAFLSGRNEALRKRLSGEMQAASDALDFEGAARFRDRLRALSEIVARQRINVANLVDEADIIAAHAEGGRVCIQVFFYRAGRNYGNRAYFPRVAAEQPLAEVLASFIGQFYADKPVPRLVMLSQEIDDMELVAEALSTKADQKVQLKVPQRGDRRRLVNQALSNAREALARKLSEVGAQATLLAGVAKVFALDDAPQRIEVYDNSHNQGSAAVGAMIVAGPEGFIKSAYRKFTIKNAEVQGDDFGMMREVLERRFARLQKEDPERRGDGWPDLLLIDGGKGQLSAALEVLDGLGIKDLILVAVAKGPDRNAGRETFYRPGAPPLTLGMQDPVLYYLQRLRDEAHRFAISTHRAKAGKRMTQSLLDDIPGIGPKRKKALVQHFGSARAIRAAGVEDLCQVEGINRATAQAIYDWFYSA